jgi:hypothetical protein
VHGPVALGVGTRPKTLEEPRGGRQIAEVEIIPQDVDRIVRIIRVCPGAIVAEVAEIAGQVEVQIAVAGHRHLVEVGAVKVEREADRQRC